MSELPIPTLCGIMTRATWERLLSEDLDPLLRLAYADWIESTCPVEEMGEAAGWRKLVALKYTPILTPGLVPSTEPAWVWLNLDRVSKRGPCGWYMEVRDRKPPIPIPTLIPQETFYLLYPTHPSSGAAGAGYPTSLEAEKDMVRVLSSQVEITKEKT